MGLLKRAENTEPVSRQEFDALAAQIEAVKALVGYAFAAVEFASKAGPGMPDASPRGRLEKLAAFMGLEPAESAELKSFLKRLDAAGRIESKREFAEAQASTRPRTGADFRVPSWRG